MTRDQVSRHTQIVAELAGALSANDRLRAELQRARRQFFGDAASAQADDAAEHRFAEWFLFERESESLGAVPAQVAPYAERAQELEDSIAGLFLVETVGDSVNARDVQSGEIVELDDKRSLQVGDLLVGRLYPAAQERWSASAATPALRPGRELADAVLRDLEQLEVSRRLQQIELEHLLLRQHGATAEAVLPGPPPEPLAPLEHLEADLQQLLQRAGGRHEAEHISQQLAAAPRPGPLVGPLLDQLAFDTDVDLDHARRLLLEIWNAHHAGRAPERAAEEGVRGGPPGETLGEKLVRTLDEGLSDRQDVEQVFSQLEQLAGIEPEEEEEDADAAAALVQRLAEAPSGALAGGDDVDAGDLAPLVTEYHWETGTADADASALQLWVELQRNAPVPTTQLEAISAQDVMRLLLHVYLRSAPDERAAQVREAFDELTRFYDWLTVTQEMDLRAVLRACEGPLLEQLDRLQDAGVALTNDEAPARAPGLLQIEEIGRDGFGARDDDGGGYWLAASPDALGRLEVGDLLLAGVAPPDPDAPTSMHARLAGLAVVLPVDARALIE
ncbi:MAG: hypothetical protein ACON4Z_08825 [Planctomycetota bacterium]